MAAYTFQIKNELVNKELIINDLCWEYEFKKHFNNYNDLLKVVLKPNNKYKILIVESIPRTFHKSKMFNNILDENISTFILSPFDEEAIRKLPVYISNYSTESIDEFIDELRTRSYFRKCIQFVKRKGTYVEEEITNTYIQLIKDIVDIFISINADKPLQ